MAAALQYTSLLCLAFARIVVVVDAHQPHCENGGTFSHFLDKCRCHHTFYGDSCQFSCNHGSPRYRSKGWWFGEEWFVRCECFPGWMGHDCGISEGSYHTTMPPYVTLQPNPYPPPPHVVPPPQNQHEIRAGGYMQIPDSSNWKVGIILGTIAFALVILIIGIACGVFWKRRRTRRRVDKGSFVNYA